MSAKFFTLGCAESKRAFVPGVAFDWCDDDSTTINFNLPNNKCQQLVLQEEKHKP